MERERGEGNKGGVTGLQLGSTTCDNPTQKLCVLFVLRQPLRVCSCVRSRLTPLWCRIRGPRVARPVYMVLACWVWPMLTLVVAEVGRARPTYGSEGAEATKKVDLCRTRRPRGPRALKNSSPHNWSRGALETNGPSPVGSTGRSTDSTGLVSSVFRQSSISRQGLGFPSQVGNWDFLHPGLSHPAGPGWPAGWIPVQPAHPEGRGVSEGGWEWK